MKEIFFLTAFPEIITSVLSQSILRKAKERGFVNYSVKNLFDYADPPHNRIDDYPFGGGVGMVIKPETVFRAMEEVLNEYSGTCKPRVVFPTPDGYLLKHERAIDLAQDECLVFICGHYKGIDQRIRDRFVMDEISIGDYVLTGGELPSIVILDSVVRLIPGVINKYESAMTDSFSDPLLDFPHYTRPEMYRGMDVPEVLLSGNHNEIKKWRKINREVKTKERRPDLWEKYNKIEKER